MRMISRKLNISSTEVGALIELDESIFPKIKEIMTRNEPVAKNA
jgi:hypothetical protein